jgi:hypothetical protein
MRPQTPPHKEQPDYKFDHASVRFHKPYQALPNFEPRSFCRVCTPARRVAVSIAGDVLHASPLELQIVYKLWLGFDKYYESVVFIYSFAKSRGILNQEELEAWARRLGAPLEGLRRSTEET